MKKLLNESNLSNLAGALAFLLISVYFISIVLYGQPGIAEPFIITGIGLFFCCVIIYLAKKYPIKKIALAIGTGICVSLLVLVIVVLIGTSLVSDLSPPLPVGSSPGSMEYNRTITLDAPLPVSPATVPLYRVVSAQRFSTGTGTAFTVKKQIPATGEAPGLAEKALEKYGGLPADAVLERTGQVFMKKYNLQTGTVEEQYPQYTQVIYRQYVNGSPVINSEISVSLGENGELLDLSKDWSTLEPAGKVPVISANEAFEKLQARDLFIPIQGSLDGYHISRVQSGYYVETHLPDASALPVPPDTCTPVWIFYGIKPGTDSDPFPLLINATRG
ncbi:hypothetical protein [Methanoregula sp.]|uniref:hypothetical protein n=1 Tax=Methanoregula sp. TaxID=2052170 RepID=UPI00356B3031